MGALFSKFGKTEGATIKIWGKTGSSSGGTTAWNKGKSDPVFEVDLDDPAWDAIFGAFQKGKYKDGVSALSKAEKISEGTKRLIQVFTVEEEQPQTLSNDSWICSNCGGTHNTSDTAIINEYRGKEGGWEPVKNEE